VPRVKRQDKNYLTGIMWSLAGSCYLCSLLAVLAAATLHVDCQPADMSEQEVLYVRRKEEIDPGHGWKYERCALSYAYYP
jgi:hypothetical protein